MSLESVVLFVHVVAAVVLFGHSLLTPLVIGAIRSAASAEALRGWLRLARDSGRANPIAALALLATGIHLASGRWGEAWLPAACVLWALNSALAVGVVKATGERLAAASAGASGAITPELDALRRSPRWSAAADALVANDLAALFLMSVQPGLLGSAGAIVVANAAMLLYRAVRSRGAVELPGAVREAA